MYNFFPVEYVLCKFANGILDFGRNRHLWLVQSALCHRKCISVWLFFPCRTHTNTWTHTHSSATNFQAKTRVTTEPVRRETILPAVSSSFFFLFSSFWLLHFSCLLFLLREEELPFIIIIDLIIMWLFSASMHASEINDCTSYAFVSFCFHCKPLYFSSWILASSRNHTCFTQHKSFFWEEITK